MSKPLSKELFQKICREIRAGKSKYQVSGELGINQNTIYRKTQHIPGKAYGWPGIRGKTLKMLQELITKGYVICSADYQGQKYRILKKYFPTICKIKIYNKSMLFFEDKAEVAARAFLENMDKKIMNYQDLKQVTKVFGIELSSEEKHKFIGKHRNHKLSIIRRKDGGFLSSYHKNQLKIDDYMGETGFFGKNVSKKSGKNSVSDDDVLLRDDDSLAFFYIRMY